MYQTLLPHRQWIRISGPDRHTFLQGLITNDVQKLDVEQLRYAFFLTPQGRFLFDLFIYEADDALWVDTERADDLIKRLSIYRLRSQVQLERIAGTTLTVWGEAWETYPNILSDPRHPEMGGRILYQNSDITKESIDDWDLHRIQLGIPDGARDMIVDKSFPLECGADELHAIDWNKGCYIGQELTARTHYRGLIRKLILPVTIEGPLPSVGTPIFQNEREMGDMRSSISNKGLAYLRLEALAETTPLRCGEAQLIPFIPSWVHLPQT